ncbi:MAG: DNA mismatch repair endonuclease MutL [Candidatus Brocadiia bacterium]|nr:DNA mismatch repair endonuclease MutL [Candidatus Brocadiia bacterium]
MGIRILPKALADKIAAGEVIERPASVVKELIENALDAGANRIEVELEGGGAKLMRVSDDGRGMAPGDLALAFLSHATSKLQDEADLFSVHTMGFRGEALSSIAAVSQARIVSRTAEADEGYEIHAEGGAIGEARACAAPPGTRVEVRNLFFNVPVRRKFLKSAATEMAHVIEAATRLALARPAVHFVLTHNARGVFNLPPAEGLAQRVGEFFGREIGEHLIPLSARSPGLEIEGYLLPPSVSRTGAAMQYLYVNRRYVRDRGLLHAVAEAYRGLMMSQRRPVCFLFLTVDPADVDVNVHPTKIEVRFRHAREVHGSLLSAMRETLREAKLTPQVSLTPEADPARGREAAGDRSESVRKAIADFFAGQGEDQVAARPHGGGFAAPALRPGDASSLPQQPPGHAASSPAPSPAQTTPEQPPLRAHYGGCMQVLDTYIVEESPEGIRLTDQHALHECILYGRLRRQLESGPPASQRLLVPELVELPKAEFLAVMELAEDLKRFGMDVEAFGESTVIVRSYPQMLGRFDARAFLQDVLDELEGPEGTRRVDGRLEKLLKVMACRGAVKAGQRLSAEQMRRLLEEREAAGAGETCPHGRPVSIVIAQRELERQFGRT